MRSRRPFALTVLTGLLALVAPGLPAAADTAPIATPSDGPVAPFSTDVKAYDEQAGPADEQRYIVTFADETAPREGAEAVRARGGEVEDVLRHAVSGAVADLTAHQAAALAHNPHVAAVQPDRIASVSGTDSSPTWGLDRIDQRGLPLTTSFTTGTSGAGVTAYVIDTGVAPHSEFGRRLADGYSAVGDGGIGATDCNGHGTHVAGTIGGSTYGVAEKVTIVPVRALGCNGSGSYSQIISGIEWMISHHPAGTPAVANLSLGGPAASYLDEAVESAIADGITMVIAAGNDNVDACTSSPGRTPAAVTVGATNYVDARASFSNYGSCLDLFAPGVSITSADESGGSATMSGTSMAAPHVAGAAAALLESAPSLSPSQVATKLAGNATQGAVTGTTGSPNRLLWADPKLTAYVAPAPAPTEPIESAPSEPVQETQPVSQPAEPAPAPAPSQPAPAPSQPAPAPAPSQPAPEEPADPAEPTEPQQPSAPAPDTELVDAPDDGQVVLRRSVRIRYGSRNADDFVCTLDGEVRPCGDGSVRLRGLRPGSHVFTVAARTTTSGVDATAESVSFVVPHNNTDLHSSRAWRDRRGRGYYLRSYSTTRRHGARLTARVSDVREIALIATEGRRHGRVKVYLGRQLLDRISLRAAGLDKRRVIPVDGLDRAMSGRLRIVVVSRGRPVRIEGLALTD